jgi:hypothetical protein
MYSFINLHPTTPLLQSENGVLEMIANELQIKNILFT